MLHRQVFLFEDSVASIAEKTLSISQETIEALRKTTASCDSSPLFNDEAT